LVDDAKIRKSAFAKTFLGWRRPEKIWKKINKQNIKKSHYLDFFKKVINNIKIIYLCVSFYNLKPKMLKEIKTLNMNNEQ